MKYRRKSPKIEAILWTGDNLEEVKKFTSGYLCDESIFEKGVLFIYTMMSSSGSRLLLTVFKNHYILKDAKTKQIIEDTIDQKTFENTFEKVEE